MARHLLEGIPPEHLLDDVDLLDTFLGRGAYGKVNLGTWNENYVAIKRHWTMLIRDENGEGLSAKYRSFLREYLLLCDFSHPNIVKVYGMVPPLNDLDSPGIVMEYLPIDLRKRYSQEPYLTNLEQLTIAQGIASGLKYLHNSRNLLHRDLTTSNVMLTTARYPGGEKIQAKITDIGCARLIEANLSAQTMTPNPGVQAYMAPETRLRDHVCYGYPSDCYAFGVTILAMTIRREPPPIEEIAFRGRGGDINSMARDNPFQPIVKACLQDEPHSRPSAASLCEQLSAFSELVKYSQPSRGLGEDNLVGSTTSSPDIISQAEGKKLREEIAYLHDEVASAKRLRAASDRNYERFLSFKEDQQRTISGYQEELAVLRQALCSNRADKQALGHRLTMELDEALRELGSCRTAAAERETRREPVPSDVDLDVGSESHGCPSPGVENDPSLSPLALAQTVCQSFDSRTYGVSNGTMKKPKPSSAATNQGSPFQWMQLGEIPQGAESTCAQPCIHNGCLVSAFTKESRLMEARLYQTPLHHPEGVQWKDIPFPEGHWHVDCYLFSYVGCLFAALIPANRRLQDKYQIYRRTPSNQWEHFIELPEAKFRFGLAIVGKELIVFGGRVQEFGAATLTVWSLDLHQKKLCAGSSWVRLDNLPQPCDSPKFAIFGNTLHIISFRCNAGQEPMEPISMKMSEPQRKRKWITGLLPVSPSAESAPAVLDGRLVLAGGNNGSTAIGDVKELSKNGKVWRSLPHCSPRFFGHCLAEAGGHLVTIGGMNANRHQSKEIEMLSFA